MQIFNRRIKISGIEIFYREAGERQNPSILLLHGFPSSSVMFKNLMVALSDNFHLIAPDYPGFGFSSFPRRDIFEYSFSNIAACLSQFIEAVNLNLFTIYLHDYGCSIGLRLCMAHPGKIERVIVQNGNVYEEGLGPQWDETRDYWDHPTPGKKAKVAGFLSEEGVKMQYLAGVPESLLPNISPELWMLDWELMKRPGNIEMQFGLNCDYKTNIEKFPAFQEYLRNCQPPALIIWGRYDPFFSVAEAGCFKRDLPDAAVHILEGSHMLMETNFEEVLQLIAGFLPADGTY